RAREKENAISSHSMSASRVTRPGRIRASCVLATGLYLSAILFAQTPQPSLTKDQRDEPIRLHDTGVDALLEGLKHADADMRARAAKALGDMGDTRAIEPLIVSLKDPYSDVRRAALESLRRLKVVVIPVEPRMLKAMDSIGPDFVFFTSANSPIT